MNALLAFVRLLRLPNLIMVLLTMWVPYYMVLRPALLKAGGVPVLDATTFGLMAIATVLTTFGGYILNDYYDRFIDAVNKPNRVVWGVHLPAGLALLWYVAVLTVVHLSAFLIDFQLKSENHWPIWVFPGVSFFLFLYAWQLKCTALAGNFMVSLLCAVVPVLVLIPEERPVWLASYQHPEPMQQAVSLVWMYAFFAFLTNLLREQIKDLEDFKGDAACGCMTLAVLKGPRFARKPAVVTGLLLIGFVAVLLNFLWETGAPLYQVVAGFFLLLLPAVAATYRLLRATTKRDYRKSSYVVKLMMLAGLFLLLRSWPTPFNWPVY
jgi:4-hydroxybenzoate polyprenyltransferase